jgi:hypothetical protein
MAQSEFSPILMKPNQSMKPTALLRGNFKVFATTPCRGLFGLPVYVARVDSASARKPHPLGSAHPCRSHPSGSIPAGSIQRACHDTLPWLISLTYDLPGSCALSGCPVHLADSQSARFSLGNAQPRHRADETTQNEIPNACVLHSCIYLVTEHSHIDCSVCKSGHYPL